MAKMNAEKFAQAYIQTLPHTKKPDEFESDEEYNEYLDRRFHVYLSEYVNAIERVQELGESDDQINDLSDKEI